MNIYVLVLAALVSLSDQRKPPDPRSIPRRVQIHKVLDPASVVTSELNIIVESQTHEKLQFKTPEDNSSSSDLQKENVSAKDSCEKVQNESVSQILEAKNLTEQKSDSESPPLDVDKIKNKSFKSSKKINSTNRKNSRKVNEKSVRTNFYSSKTKKNKPKSDFEQKPTQDESFLGFWDIINQKFDSFTSLNIQIFQTFLSLFVKQTSDFNLHIKLGKSVSGLIVVAFYTFLVLIMAKGFTRARNVYKKNECKKDCRQYFDEARKFLNENMKARLETEQKLNLIITRVNNLQNGFDKLKNSKPDDEFLDFIAKNIEDVWKEIGALKGGQHETADLPNNNTALMNFGHNSSKKSPNFNAINVHQSTSNSVVGKKNEPQRIVPDIKIMAPSKTTITSILPISTIAIDNPLSNKIQSEISFSSKIVNKVNNDTVFDDGQRLEVDKIDDFQISINKSLESKSAKVLANQTSVSNFDEVARFDTITNKKCPEKAMNLKVPSSVTNIFAISNKKPLQSKYVHTMGSISNIPNLNKPPFKTSDIDVSPLIDRKSGKNSGIFESKGFPNQHSQPDFRKYTNLDKTSTQKLLLPESRPQFVLNPIPKAKLSSQESPKTIPTDQNTFHHLEPETDKLQI
jgi:hypothetical protein